MAEIERLSQRAQDVLTVSSESAAAYRAAGLVMVGAVDSAVPGRADAGPLIGHNPPRVAADNHLHHHRFLSEVFEFGLHELLVRTLPWVYRAYIGHGFQPAYFEVELRAWKAALQACLPPEQAAALVPAYDWMLEEHDTILALSEEPLPTAVGGLPKGERVRKLLSSLLRGDVGGAQQALVDGGPLSELYVDAIQPAMERVGELWEQDEISVAEEHVATAVAGRLMSALVDHSAVEGPSAIVAALPGERHELGARMVADLLAEDGWAVTYVGPDVPEADLLKLVRLRRPRLVALSMTMPFHLHSCAGLIGRLRREDEEGATRVLVGGRVLRQAPDLWGPLGADGYAPDARQAVDVVKGWRVG